MKKNYKLIIILFILCITILIIVGYINKVEKRNKSKNEINIVGNWSPYKIEIDNKEVDLKEYYGTGIKYGGYLTFNDDLTYSELIGVYSEEIVDSLKGTYTQQEKSITLTSKDNKHNTYEVISKNNTNVIKKVTEDNYIIYFKQVIE